MTAPSSSPLRVAVAGASGRMGRMLVEAIQNSADCTLTAALDLPHSPAIGTDAAAFLGQTSGVLIESDLKSALSKADFLIDFTPPKAPWPTWPYVQRWV